MKRPFSKAVQIRRDRNHPSVVAWEASLNETGFPDAWALQTHTIVHQEYPGDQAFSAQWNSHVAGRLLIVELLVA